MQHLTELIDELLNEAEEAEIASGHARSFDKIFCDAKAGWLRVAAARIEIAVQRTLLESENPILDQTPARN